MNIIYFVEFHCNKLSLLRVVVHKLFTLLPFEVVNEKTIFVHFNGGFFFTTAQNNANVMQIIRTPNNYKRNV